MGLRLRETLSPELREQAFRFRGLLKRLAQLQAQGAGRAYAVFHLPPKPEGKPAVELWPGDGPKELL